MPEFIDFPSPAYALHGRLDVRLVDSLKHEMRTLRPNQRNITVDCTAVTGVDDVGAALLTLFCREKQRRGIPVRLVGLRDSVARLLRAHPVRAFLESDDDIFRDPFPRPAVSGR